MSDSKHHNATRRNILSLSALTLGGAGACALSAPFLNSLRGTDAALEQKEAKNPILELDLVDLAPGASKIIAWQEYPVLILHRTEEMIAALQEQSFLSSLQDPYSKICQQPKDAANTYRSVNPYYSILILICTHLGCIPNAQSTTNDHKEGALLCPCHGSQFDGAGRVFKNMPAPYNLPIPPVTFLTKTKIRLGESKGDPTFKISQIQQL